MDIMATINKGIAPADPSTPVGKVRFLIGDLDYAELDPVEAGLGEYPNFSDDEINGFLIAGDDSVIRASGYAYLRLAVLAAAGAISWKSDDQMVDAKQVATEFRLLATLAFNQADAADEAGASTFAIDNPYSTNLACGHAELAPDPWCPICTGASRYGWY